MLTRDEVRIALDHNFKLLIDCLGQLTEDELTTQIVAGAWTVKDVLAHVWDWDDEATHTAKAWHAPRPWQEGVSFDDGWNETHVNARRGLPLITIIDGATGAHRRLENILDMADDTVLAEVGQPPCPWGAELSLLEMIYNIAEHYADHAQSLDRYQRNCLDAEEASKNGGSD